ncbi:TlpA family protein disulfide reductase [Roseateles sp. BYS180W]|uniref:TlpA family protein disulfide reductase n=1 Tax=Roseateles rivi TaxID=3299028 RepID=A0ABW7FQX9_9BURK
MRTFAKVIATAIFFAGSLRVVHATEVEYKALPNFGLAAGVRFPLESLVDPGGSEISADRLLGKAVLINFYTKYCAPCIKEVPKLNRVMERRSDINVLAITPDGRADAQSYVKQYGLNWPVAADAAALLSKRLNVEAFPGFALLDAKGRLLATVYANQLGGDDGHATVEGIEAWLNAQLRKAAK